MIPASAAAEVVDKYDLELAVIVGHDGLRLDVASFGKQPMGKDVAADWADQIPTLLGFDDNKQVHEDYRATPAAESKHKFDVAMEALRRVGNWVPAATLHDGQPVVSLSECWKIQEVAREAIKKLRGQ